MAKVKPIPDGFHTVTPYLTVKDAAKAIDFYKRAFGAEEIDRHPAPGGKKIMHATIKIGDSMVMLADEFPEYGSFAPKDASQSCGGLHLYVQDADKVFNQAVKAGAKVEMPIADMFWGDRYGKLADPFGLKWSVGTHIKDVTPAEMEQAAKQAFAMKPGHK